VGTWSTDAPSQAHAPVHLRDAAVHFFLAELRRPSPETQNGRAISSEAANAKQPEAAQAGTLTADRAFPTRFVLEALAKSSDETGWAQLWTFGSYLTKPQPDFDVRLFGCRKMSDRVKARTDLFVVEERETPGSPHKVLYVRAS
jgi:hypothetical protein